MRSLANPTTRPRGRKARGLARTLRRVAATLHGVSRRDVQIRMGSTGKTKVANVYIRTRETFTGHRVHVGDAVFSHRWDMEGTTQVDALRRAIGDVRRNLHKIRHARRVDEGLHCNVIAFYWQSPSGRIYHIRTRSRKVIIHVQSAWDSAEDRERVARELFGGGRVLRRGDPGVVIPSPGYLTRESG